MQTRSLGRQENGKTRKIMTLQMENEKNKIFCPMWLVENVWGTKNEGYVKCSTQVVYRKIENKLKFQFGGDMGKR